MRYEISVGCKGMRVDDFPDTVGKRKRPRR